MDINKLKGHIPQAVIDQLPATMKAFSIDTPLRLSHFLAQCATESDGWEATVENLNYSATALMATWKTRFPTLEVANEYARQPIKIGNKAYESRMGNGPESSGDGYKYRGRGYIQLTGKDNYTNFNKKVPSPDNVVVNPDLVSTKYPLLSAAWFWNNNVLNSVADKGSTPDVVKNVTQVINGGQNGYSDRLSHFNIYYPLLNS